MSQTNDQSQARARVLDAQQQMENVNADNARINEFALWLREAAERVERFSTYYSGHLYDDVEAAAFDDDTAPRPEVAGEDLPYFAVVEHDAAVRRLLREVTAMVTADLDD